MNNTPNNNNDDNIHGGGEDTKRNIHWVNVVRESKLTETIASQIIRDTSAFHHHKTNPSIRPYASDNFKLYPTVFCIKQVNRSEVHKVCVLQDMLEAVQKISHDDFVYVCPVSLNRLGNSKQQIDFFVKTLRAIHPHAYLMPLREFGIPLETLTAQLDKYEADRKAVSEVTTANDQGKSVQVMDGYDDEREVVEQGAKKVYSDFCDGKEYLKELCESGLKNAKAHIVDSGFEKKWLSIQKKLEQGKAYNILDSIVTKFGSGMGEVEEEAVIGLLARSSPSTSLGRVRVMYGVPMKQMSYMISHMKCIYGEKNFTKLKIMIFYDADHSGYSYTNTEFIRFMDLFRSGIFSKVFMSSPARASRKSAPVKSIEYVKQKTNTEVNFSKHIGQDVNELVRKEEERQQENKLATQRWNDFVSDQRDRLPSGTNTGVITRDVSSFMMTISNTHVTKEVRERFADDIKRFTSVGNSDVIKTTTTWGDDDDDDSSVESANMEEEGT
mmetsp:Transcript_34577/g.70735  ORF Transcript_34577/g.70735 Transcript_34577/m.70735 type:complete len:497 (-) Transcript_34577:769-2259(-)